jgi:hypothetical protein
VLDFVGDDENDGNLSVLDLSQALGARYVRSAGAGDVLAAVLSTVVTRTKAGDYGSASELLVLVGLERALSLKPVDPYADEDEVSPSSALLGILQAGPEVGVHVLVAADRVGTVERRLGSESLHELTIRIAGSTAGQHDLAQASGEYGEVTMLRHGQLLVGDHVRGTTKRLRGYETLTRTDLTRLVEAIGDQ